MAEARDFLKQDLDNEKQEKSAIEEITKTLNQVHFTSKVKLNVGGKIYKTTLDTLRKDPDSMLCAMFSGRFDRDRDRKHFRYILNYLRDGELLCPDYKTIRKELLAEAKFYQIQGIIAQLEEKTSPFNSSWIIKKEKHHSALTSWLPPNATCSLLYRASPDQRKPADFHRCCDNKGPTLVVIKSKRYIFGGYTTQSWESASPWEAIKDSQSFLFTLINPSGSDPIKITPTPGAAIRCDSSTGPTFGNRQYYDLQVSSERDQLALCYFDLGYGFTCPDIVNRNTYFTGKNPSEISELEVFEVSL